MVLESAQMLCTIAREHGSTSLLLYKPTHPNHPCVRWLADSMANCLWLVSHARAMNNERRRRGATEHHRSLAVAEFAWVQILAGADMPSLPTPFAQAMPDQCKHADSVHAYRAYYAHKRASWREDGKVMTWQKSPTIPAWMAA